MWDPNSLVGNVANQLTPLFEDYDVAIIVASYYVKMRNKMSEKKSRKFHIKCLREKFGSELILLRSGLGQHYHSHDLFKSMISYMISKKGIRSNHNWRTMGASWGIPNLNKINPTINDKATDLKIIDIKIIKSFQFRSIIWE